MIIIMMSGGLGNQMFQYALYCRLQELGREVKMDDKRGFEGDVNGRVPRLKEVFGVDYETASDKEVNNLLDSNKDIFSIAKRKIFGRKSKRYREKSGIFDEELFNIDNVYLDGYWQSEKYFDSSTVKERLKKDFYLPESDIIKSPHAKEIFDKISSTESVSVHIRRGDYLNPGVVENHGGICTEEYYSKAMDLLRKKKNDAKFFFFSNDIKWVKQHYKDMGEIVELENEDMDVAELFLMSSCKNHILANSSFSWWSAWLGDSSDKLIVVPSKWANLKQMDDIYTDRMIRI